MGRKTGVSIKTTHYATFKGADFASDPALVNKSRSPICTNIVSDGGGMPEKRLGWRVLHTFAGERINGLHAGSFEGEEIYLAHVGTKFYKWDDSSAVPELLMEGVNDARSRSANLGGKLWIVTGGEFLCYDGEELKRVSGTDAYAPLTVITRAPSGGGVPYEAVNLATAFRKNGFQGDGESSLFTLDAEHLDWKLKLAAALTSGTIYATETSTIHSVYYFTASRDYAAGEILELDTERKKVRCGETEEELSQGSVPESSQSLATLAYLTDDCLVTAEVSATEHAAASLWGEIGCYVVKTSPYLKAGVSYYMDAGARGKFSFTASRDYGSGTAVRFDFAKMKVIVGEEEEEMVSGKISAATLITDRCAEYRLSVDRAAGSVSFKTINIEDDVTSDYTPPAPGSGGGDNVTVTFAKTVWQEDEKTKERSKASDKIHKCTILTTYGIGNNDRLVLSGNSDEPNVDWTSAMDDASYFPDLNYAAVGSEAAAIMGYLRIGEHLGIVKEDNGQDSTIFLRSAKLDSGGEAAFTLRQAFAGVGAISPGTCASLLDDPLFLSASGIYGIATSELTGAKVTQNRSYYLNPRLVKEPGLNTAEAVVWKGMYLIATGNGHVYLLDGRQEKSWRSETMGDFIYEGYYWEGVPAWCWMKWTEGLEERLYFGTEDGRICKFNTDISDLTRYSDGAGDTAIAALWGTKMDDDGDPTLLKTMLKRGAAVTVKPYSRGSAKVFIRTGDMPEEQMVRMVREQALDIFSWEDIDFTRLSFDTNDQAREIFLNTKVKKYKRLQILAGNDAINEGFGIYEITKHFVVGNFAKR